MTAEAEVRRTARALANLRKTWAEEFLRSRKLANYTTDNQARAAADLGYVIDLTMAEAEYEIAKAHLAGRH